MKKLPQYSLKNTGNITLTFKCLICKTSVGVNSKRHHWNLVCSVFKILVVRSPGTTKTWAGQLKIMLCLSGGQPKIYSQKLLFQHVSLFKPDTADKLLKIQE